MAVSKYSAKLNYYDTKYGWGNKNTTAQGNGAEWTAGTRTGVMYFPGLASLKGKIINSVEITVSTQRSGWNADKTAYFYQSASQGGIKTSLNANHKTGNSIGNISGSFYDNTLSFPGITFLSSYIAAGEDTYCIYSGLETHYLVWDAVTLEVNWSEPATVPVVSSSVALGSATTITVNPSNSAYTHTLTYKMGSTSGTIATKTATRAVAWTPPLTLASAIPSAVSGSATITCETFNGSTSLGKKTATMTLSVPSTVKPTAGTLAAIRVEDTSGMAGMYIQGMCKTKLTLTGAAGVYGSTIKSYKIWGTNFSDTQTPCTTNVLNTAGTLTFYANVTDSRGRTSGNVSVQITVAAYSPPALTACPVFRCDASGVKKDAGTYFSITPGVTYSAVGINALTLSVQYKKTSDASYGASTALANNTKRVLGGGAISTSFSYQVLVTFADKFNTRTAVFSLSTALKVLSMKQNLGAAFGKVAETNDLLDVAWNARVRKSLELDENLKVVGGIYLDTPGKGIYLKSKSGTVQEAAYTEGDSLVFGFGNYNNASGSSWLYGNGVRIVSKTGTIVKGLLTCDSGIGSDGNITFKNNVGIRAYATTGENVALCAMNQNDDMLFGYGTYGLGRGVTSLYGYQINLTSSTNIRASQSILPNTTNAKDLGSTTYRWKNIYLNNSPSVSSDRKVKHNIGYRALEDEQALDLLVAALTACTYYASGNDKRQIGFIAQDVAGSLYAAGLPDMDIVCITHRETGIEYTYSQVVEQNIPDEELDYALRYERFVPLLTSCLKLQQHRISTMQDSIMAIDTRVIELENKYTEVN